VNWSPAPYDPWIGLHHRLVSEHNLIQMGVYPVNFGHRVRAGFVDDKYGVLLDWCAGGKWKDVERLYSLLHGILSAREENDACFHGLPGHSNIKPFYNDPEFVNAVFPLAGNFSLITLDPIRHF